jgi:hypothetical protein
VLCAGFPRKGRRPFLQVQTGKPLFCPTGGSKDGIIFYQPPANSAIFTSELLPPATRRLSMRSKNLELFEPPRQESTPPYAEVFNDILIF